MAQTLGDIYQDSDRSQLTDRAQRFTKSDVENIFHGNFTSPDVTVHDIKSMYKVAVGRTNGHQPMFCFSEDLNLADDGTANCHTCY